jgi:hypothetical protein
MWEDDKVPLTRIEQVEQEEEERLRFAPPCHDREALSITRKFESARVCNSNETSVLEDRVLLLSDTKSGESLGASAWSGGRRKKRSWTTAWALGTMCLARGIFLVTRGWRMLMLVWKLAERRQVAGQKRGRWLIRCMQTGQSNARRRERLVLALHSWERGRRSMARRRRGAPRLPTARLGRWSRASLPERLRLPLRLPQVLGSCRATRSQHLSPGPRSCRCRNKCPARSSSRTHSSCSRSRSRSRSSRIAPSSRAHRGRRVRNRQARHRGCRCKGHQSELEKASRWQTLAQRWSLGRQAWAPPSPGGFRNQPPWGHPIHPPRHFPRRLGPQGMEERLERGEERFRDSKYLLSFQPKNGAESTLSGKHECLRDGEGRLGSVA